ncbi:MULTISPECIES: hypothetical protein [unclassified Sulfitobacter]|jgi:hypothetical protein|uniref:hypothetical protein n=1 Tax=unclassified Sulfitobacter TaxID=196795 RepID=UPI003744ECEE|tara:strand:- start:749 stop:1090 length:342 start_codon:yes stop_codon:yes gene_type:complete
MTHSATYDRKAIMTAAWEIVRKANVALYGFRVIMRRALKAAWANAKHERAMEARQAKQEQASPAVARIQGAIDALEGKERWAQADYARIGVLRAALRAAQQPDQDASARFRLR